MNTPRMANGIDVAGDRPRLAVRAVLAHSSADEERTDEGGDATGHVHDAGAGEVGEDGVADRDAWR